MNDDYTAFRPVAQAVRTQALPSGPMKGYQGQSRQTERAPITHPFVSQPPAVDRPANQSVPLLLLLEPRSAVYATSGVLPRKRLVLPPASYEAGLAALAPTFRAGPVLVDPKTLTLPVPIFEDAQWSFVHRGDAGAFTEDPVAPPVSRSCRTSRSSSARDTCG